MLTNPIEIEKRSMEIIESELTVSLSEEIKPIVKRVIHATADFSFAESMYFSPNAVERIRAMIKEGATIVTDTNMALSGINRRAADTLNVKLICDMASKEVALQAKERGVTRASILAERALSIKGYKLLVCGNAPTFLMSLLDTLQGIVPKDIAVVGVPVGFVNVVEAKEALRDSGLTCLAAMGRRGGSNVAAAIVNALMYSIEGVRA